MSAPLPNRIMVWHGTFSQLTHTGTWATTRYPETAVPFVPEAKLQEAHEALPLIQSVLDDESLPRDQHDALTCAADAISGGLRPGQVIHCHRGTSVGITRRPPHGTGMLIAGVIAGAFWLGFALGLFV